MVSLLCHSHRGNQKSGRRLNPPPFLDCNHLNLALKIENNRIVEGYASLPGVRIQIIEEDEVDESGWEQSNAIYAVEVSTDC